ncbi:hypothetical protein [Collinsella sp. CLA-JM-H32B]|uniref:hypothetical protein n=1 Tax=Collinsella sp. CLA-JM-H32B TaxID=3136221 RepID=UPI0032BFE699
MADTGAPADNFQMGLSDIYIRVIFTGKIFALNEITDDCFLVFRTIVYYGRCIHRYSCGRQFLLPDIDATVPLDVIKATKCVPITKIDPFAGK